MSSWGNEYIKRWLKKVEYSPKWYVVKVGANGVTCRTVETSKIDTRTPLAVIATCDRLADGRNWLCVSYCRLDSEGALATDWKDGRLVRETFFEPNEVTKIVPPKGTDMTPYINSMNLFHCVDDNEEKRQIIFSR